MSFLHPEFIYMMLPALVVLFALLLTQSGVQEQFFSPRILAKLRVDTKRLSARLRNFFFFLMFLFIILALAGPVIEKGEAEVKVKGNLFFVALDISDSMRCKDVYPNRLEAGKQKLLALLEHDRNDRIGLIAFAESSYLVAPPTMDHALLAFLLKPMESTPISEQGTNIFTLLKAADHLLAEQGVKKLLLISDGGDNRDFSDEIAFAKQRNIQVSILGVGTDTGGVIYDRNGVIIKAGGSEVVSRFNGGVARLAAESGGLFIRAGSGDIEKLLSAVATHESENGVQKIYFHVFIIPIALAMLMLLIATSSFHRGEKYYLPAILAAALVLAQPVQLQADFFGFSTLERAKEAYDSADYRASSREYKEYALKNKSAEAVFNAANGYYRMGSYETAAGLYASIYFAQAEKNHELYHNLGNALAKLGDRQHLFAAAEAYKQALIFKEDSETRENLEQVEKALRDRRHNEESTALKRVLPSSSASQKSGTGGELQPSSSSSGSMSDSEAAKWFKILDSGRSGQYYRIEVADPGEGADHESPW